MKASQDGCSFMRANSQLIFRLLLAVEAVHGCRGSVSQNHLHSFCSFVQYLVHCLELRFRERPQYVSHTVLNLAIRRDAQPDSQELFRTKRPNQRLHPVVTRRAATLRSTPSDLVADTAARPRPHRNRLFLFLLLGFCCLLCAAFLGSFFFGLLFTLLDDLGFCRYGGSFGSHGFRCRRRLLFHTDDVRHTLVLVREHLEFVTVRQVCDPQHLAEDQLCNVRLDQSRNVAGQALDFNLAQHLLQNATLLLHTSGFALQHDRYHHRKLLVHGDALQINVQELALDRLELPVHDHGLGALAAVQRELENRVVTACGMQDTEHLAWIHTERCHIFACTIEHRGNLAAPAYPPGIILCSRSARLRFQNIGLGNFGFGCSSHNLDSCSYTNNLLTEVSS